MVILSVPVESFLDSIWLAIGDLEPLGEDFGENEASSLRVSSFIVSSAVVSVSQP